MPTNTTAPPPLGAQALNTQARSFLTKTNLSHHALFRRHLVRSLAKSQAPATRTSSRLPSSSKIREPTTTASTQSNKRPARSPNLHFASVLPSTIRSPLPFVIHGGGTSTSIVSAGHFAIAELLGRRGQEKFGEMSVRSYPLPRVLDVVESRRGSFALFRERMRKPSQGGGGTRFFARTFSLTY